MYQPEVGSGQPLREDAANLDATFGNITADTLFEYVFVKDSTYVDAARDHCSRHYNAILPIITSGEQLAEIVQMAQDNGIQSFPINLERADSDQPWLSTDLYGNTDSTAYDGLEDADQDGNPDVWSPGEPNNYKNNENCAAFRPGGLYDVTCGPLANEFAGTVCMHIVTTTTFQTTSTTRAETTTTEGPEPTTASPTAAPTPEPTPEPTPAGQTLAPTPAPVFEGPPFNRSNHNDELLEFVLYEYNSRWTDAAGTCAIAGGQLASIQSLADQNDIARVLAATGTDAAWIGGYRVAMGTDDEDFSWNDGTGIFSGTPDMDGDGKCDFWADSEPNNKNLEENCIVMKADEGWVDVPCTKKYAFLCEIPRGTTSSTIQTTTSTADKTSSSTFATTSTTFATSSSTFATTSTTFATSSSTAATTTTTEAASTTTTEQPATLGAPGGFEWEIITGKFKNVESAERACYESGGAFSPVFSVHHMVDISAKMAAAGVKTCLVNFKRVDGANSDASFEGHFASGSFNETESMAFLKFPDTNGDGTNDLWNSGEPNNYKDNEDCVAIQNGGFNDAACFNNRGYQATLCGYYVTTTTYKSTSTTVQTTSTTQTSTTFETSSTTFATSTTTFATSTSTVASSTTTEATSTTTVATSTTTEGVTSTSTFLTTTTTAEPTTVTTIKYTRSEAAVEDSLFYYKFYDELLSWDDAQAVCEADNGALAIVTSARTMRAIWNEAQSQGFGQFWINGRRIEDLLRSRRDDSEWEYVDENGGSKPVPDFGFGMLDVDGNEEIDAWMKKEPNNLGGNEDCIRVGKNGALWRKDGWVDSPCAEMNPFVCSKGITTTTEVPTTTTTEQSSTTTFATTTTTEEPPYEAPVGWHENTDNGCYYKIFADKKTYYEAKTFCETFANDDNSGEYVSLAAPKTLDEAMFIANLETRTGKPRWVLGEWDSTDKIWRGDGGYPSRPNQIGWYPDEPNQLEVADAICLSQAISRKVADKTPWLFNDDICSTYKKYVCQACPATTPTTTTTWQSTTTGTSTTTFATSTTTVATSTTTVATSTTTQTSTTYETTSTTAEPTTTTEAWEPPNALEGWEYSSATECHYLSVNVIKSDWKTQVESAIQCQEEYSSGGYNSTLTSISSYEEAMFVASLSGVRAGRPRWVGIERYNDSFYENIQGEAVPEFLWYAGEPRDDEICVVQGMANKQLDTTTWKINDQDCGFRAAAVCSWCGPPLPIVTTTTTMEPTTSTTQTSTTFVTSTSTFETSTSTYETTTTSTAEPPCTAQQNLHSPTADLEKLIAHIQSIGDFVGTYRAKPNGRTEPARQSCKAVCTGTTWGLGCAPCPTEYFSDIESCYAPGPFGTGEMCMTAAKGGEKSFVAPLQPCCQRGVDGVTCGVPKIDKCDCSLYETEPLFSMARNWDGKSCSENV